MRQICIRRGSDIVCERHDLWGGNNNNKRINEKLGMQSDTLAAIVDETVIKKHRATATSLDLAVGVSSVGARLRRTFPPTR